MFLLKPTCFSPIHNFATGPPVNNELINISQSISDFIGIGTCNNYYVININNIKTISDVSTLNPDIIWNKDLEKQLISFLPNGIFPSDNIKG